MKYFDDQYRKDGIRLIAGVDEAGRGPLAGPVVAAAVILPPGIDMPFVNDSKKLSASMREKLFLEITDTALAVGIEFVCAKKIDSMNILQASLHAMQRAIAQLIVKPDIILIDGNKAFASAIPAIPIVKGDGKSLSIAAASIIAKVVRDRYMQQLSETYPQYNWKQNKGYPTQEHFSAIETAGVSPFHRVTFLRKFQDRHKDISLFDGH